MINGVKTYVAKYKGKIYSLYEVDENGNVYNVKRQSQVKPYITPNDYYQVMLYNNGKSIPASIHHLVYESVTGVNPTEVHKEIDHIDSNKSNNSFSNLDLVTHAENVRRSIKSGNHLIYKNSISPHAAKQICELLQEGKTPAEIIRLTGYSAAWVRGIFNRDYCLEISKDYTWNLEPKLGISIPDSVIHNICKDIASGNLGLRAIARKYDVSPSMVMDLRHGRRRSDITSQYDFSGKTDAEKLNLGPHEVAKPYITKNGEPTNLIVTSQGRFFRTGTLKEQTPSMQHNDLCVSIKIGDGDKRNIPCKKVVAETFCENPKGYRDIINIDKNIYNLAANNLRYVSHSKSCMDNIRYDLRTSYEEDNNPNSKLTPEDVDTILRMYHEMDIKTKVIAKQFKVTKELIGKIVRGDLWTKRYLEYMNKPKGVLKIKFRTDW